MRIVVLDGYCLNPGDLSFEKLEALGDLTVHDRTPPEEVSERARDADILLTNKAVVARDTIMKASRLRYIGLLATGYDVVDVAAAAERGIPVTHVPAYGTESVAQAVFAHLLNLVQHTAHHAGTVRDGRWSASRDWCYWDRPLIELAGLAMGIIGFGRIGRAVARRALAFQMEVAAHDRVEPSRVPEGVRMADLETIFRESDTVSLHCPLTPDTERLVDEKRLAIMKPAAFLINTSRGPLVDEEALAHALNEGRIAGAGLDVLSEEPPSPANPLLRARNCFITPHHAWATRAARLRLLDAVTENIESFLAGRPRNVVNP